MYDLAQLCLSVVKLKIYWHYVKKRFNYSGCVWVIEVPHRGILNIYMTNLLCGLGCLSITLTVNGDGVDIVIILS